MNQSRWEDLFVRTVSGPVQTVTLRLLRKAGEPLLVLPTDPVLLKPALSLYPAQRLGARLARGTLRHAAGIGWPVSLKKTQVTISPRDPFVSFLAAVSGHPDGAIPPFAVFTGNPKAAGRRFIVLVFDRNKQPVAVVKAGVSGAAHQLIDREVSFLESVPGDTPGVPKLVDKFLSIRVHAFAMDFVDGASPSPRNQHCIDSLLTAWLDTTCSVRLSDLATWQRLKFDGPSQALSARAVHPSLFHGDFAPWNLRISAGHGAIVVLDWERGELSGIPGWDWFHYVIQPAILVKRQQPGALHQTADRLFASSAFKAYAEKAGIGGIERELLLAYLLYYLEVVKPTEGILRLKKLLNLLTSQWRRD